MDPMDVLQSILVMDVLQSILVWIEGESPLTLKKPGWLCWKLLDVYTFGTVQSRRPSTPGLRNFLKVVIFVVTLILSDQLSSTCCFPPPSPACGDGNGPRVRRSSRVGPGSLPTPTDLDLLLPRIATGDEQLSSIGLAAPIGWAICDLCIKYNIGPGFRPRNATLMSFLLTQRCGDVQKNPQPDPRRPMSSAGTQLVSYLRKICGQK